MTRALCLTSGDDVAVLIDDGTPGDTVLGVGLRDAIASGHKMALRRIARGETVRKYGQAIGIASTDIAAGSHVHTHNLSVGDGRAAVRAGLPSATWTPPVPKETLPLTFAGYRRDNGSVGTRNAIGVISSVNCSATVVRRIARQFEDNLPSGVDAVVPITHTRGCGMAGTGEAFETLERTLAGYARHANFGAVLMIGLGCEQVQIEGLLARYGLAPGARLRTLSIQDAGGTAEAIDRGVAIVSDFVDLLRNDRRSDCPVSDLVLGLQCGGSDGWSGITANPALGAAADFLIAAGATVLLSETPEIYGAEHLLLARAASPAVANALDERIAWWERYASRNGVSLDNNPSPGNKAGGLTTIFEKSLGAISKAGTGPLNDVILYGAPCRHRGLVFMDSPGYDPCSATGQIASGANLLAFTTGRGSAFGALPTPCLKIASNARLAAAMANDMDIDCSPILDGMSVAEAGELIYRMLVATASGQETKSERLGLGDFEFVPWDMGAWL
ncbi:UxaA family hydrolase [Hephaestia mangrovi]|uniref:UxaA family hydrolase n=1 Tax=Hephaestia mangrovi TaxID=2873268 RepID=UPI001CA7031D|nr:altronate dehydratase family protein [Hephaestia mangrovi]MBY8827316.1 altronate dehydratase family protein [Hephaestia mangrovi]